MKFHIERRAHKNIDNAPSSDHALAKKFAFALKEELSDFLKSAILFGSVARNDTEVSEPDIDVLLIVDDLSIVLSPEVTESYRVITEHVASTISTRLHITTMKLTNFWEYARTGDPVAVNMLRDGIILYDAGIFEPAQQLLFDGRIKPTRESIYTYFARAPLTLTNADGHILAATIDLYWAVMDAAHAALMSRGHVPPTPRHAAEMLHETLVRTGDVHKKYAQTLKFFFDLNKKIFHRQISRISGKEYDEFRVRAKEFVTEMERVVEGK